MVTKPSLLVNGTLACFVGLAHPAAHPHVGTAHPAHLGWHPESGALGEPRGSPEHKCYAFYSHHYLVLSIGT
jgi:hypothetical protein